MKKLTYPVTIVVEFENLDTFHIDGDIIARARADYYATEVDGHPHGCPEWGQEYEYSLSDDQELLDWLQNNMNWADIAEHATKVERVHARPDYEEMWGNADVEVLRAK